MTDFQASFVPDEKNPEIRALIDRMMVLRSRPDEFITLFQPDAVMHMVGDQRDWPYFGVYRGQAQILELLRRIDMEFELQNHRILNIVVDGDCFAVRRLLEARHFGSSQEALAVLGDFVRIRGGLIDTFFQYSDTATACRLMR
jgi:ketosteroid isomerase-like protein